MSTAIKILEDQLTEIQNTRFEKEEQFKNELSKQGIAMMQQVDLEVKNVSVESDRIRIYMPEISHWDAISVSRRSTYRDDGPKYQEPQLEWKSGDTNAELELKYIMSVGKIAEHFLNKTAWWNALVALMDQMDTFYSSEEYKALRTKEYELDRSIRDLDRQERENAFTNAFKKKRFKLKEARMFQYGQSRYDYTSSDEWEWEQNGEGKTFTLYYIYRFRSNPFYDEQGNALEAVYETRKREIPKRVRKADLESFVRKCLSSIED